MFAGYGMSETGPLLTVAHLSPATSAIPITRRDSRQGGTGMPLVDCASSTPT